MKRIVITLVVSALTAIAAEAQTLTQYEPMTENTVAFGSVTASYTTFLTVTQPLVDMDIYNGTNQSITCRLGSGASDHIDVPAYSSWSPSLAAAKKYNQLNVLCKQTSVAPTVGSVTVSGAY